MKRFLFAALSLAGAFAVLVAIAMVTHLGQQRNRDGHFDVYSKGKSVSDMSVSSDLYYRRRRLTDRLNRYAVDPNDPDRVVFSSDDAFHGAKSGAGTFLYDGNTNEWMRRRGWPYASGDPRTWSPDSHFLLLDRTTVHDLLTG